MKEILTFCREWWALLLMIPLYLYYMYQRHDSLHTYHPTNQRRKAQNPPVDKRWRRTRPEGVVLGKVGRNWYCVPEKAAGHGYEMQHVLVIGGSGTGKTSSVFAESILQNYQDMVEHPERAFRFLAVDIKGELHKTFCPPLLSIENDPDDANPYYLLDPIDRDHSVGFDPFGLIDETPYADRDLIIQVSSDIASSFVSVSEKDRYFSANALTLLSGFVAACIESSPRIEMVDMMHRILTEGVKTVMKEVYAEALPESATRFFLGRFQDKGDDNESFDDIASTMTTALNAFALNSVSYMLKDNPRKISVSAIRKKSIILSVPDSMLDENTFAPVYRMILTCMQRYLISRIPEKGTPATVLFYDELFSLGGSETGSGIPGLQHFMSIARQYGCAVVAAIQSEKMLTKQYGKDGAKILEDNMLKCILQITDGDTIRSAIDWTGKYVERKVSTSNSRKMTSNISWTREPVFDSSDFSSLVGQQKVIVVPLNDGFSRITKSQWFNESHYKTLQKKITSGEAWKEEKRYGKNEGIYE